MPQTLSKCRCRSHVFTSTPKAGERLQDKARIWCNRNRFKQKRKTDKADFVPVQTKTAHVPQEEDWEQEIEEISRRTEKGKEISNKTPYDAEEELEVALCEMSLYSVPHAPRPHQQHYDPSTHHTPPVKWIHRISCIETGQFADAKE